MTHEEYAYVGSELEIFRHARNWKRYWSERVRPFVAGSVLEVGAGLGANSEYLLGPRVTRLVRLEPDAGFVDRLAKAPLDPRVAVENRVGTLSDLPAGERFDAIVYIDVLEHIEDDRTEVETAASHLAPGGHLAVLAPAFQSLYSPFDRAIGHHRRYTAATLAALTTGPLAIVSSRYLDGPGALLSLGNRLLLRHAAPTSSQIHFWDTCIIPIATVTDVLTKRLFGRSVLCVWQSRA
jgi:2-polyprenyl-3-methyl-5-hydroxy-6-metoxy-1,4-benzoquinol methylase